ncbi:hypothetical protein [Acetivibrio saccincola]|uniref:hypothetical protein n=1 Tax=Acetivibrio saccincola TaxID=1677857 RepID=UPI0012FFF578|nr:hypothetical protein [Acetivibrio saccincola]
MSMIGNYLMVDGETIQGIISGEIDMFEFLYNTEHSDDDYLDSIGICILAFGLSR